MKRFVVLLSVFLLAVMGHAEGAEVQAKSAEAEVQADRPGALTGPTVLDMGAIQWETGFEVEHEIGVYNIMLPTTIFRFGLGPWAELRVDYTGALGVPNCSVADSSAHTQYTVAGINIGTKIRLWGGSDEPKLRWIPATSLLVNIALPTREMIADSIPFLPSADLLFENEIMDWFAIGYNIGAHWNDFVWAPSLFAGVGLYFQPIEPLGVYVENYNSFEFGAYKQVYGTSVLSEVNMEFGLSYLPHPRVQLDLYGGFNCFTTGAAVGPKDDWYIGIGAAWRILNKK